MTPAASAEKRFKTGPKSLALFEEEQNFIAPGLQTIALKSKLALESGRGCTLKDVDGNEYLDFVAGIGVASIGHAHPEYVRILTEQIARISVGSFTTQHRLNFVKTLAKHTPAGMTNVQLYSSGAEAVEAAVRLAKSKTKKYELIGFWGGFHGKTGGVLGALGDSFKFNLGPMMPGLSVSPYPNPYRCPFKTVGPHDCAAHCLDFLRDHIKRATAGALAAIIAEPIQGTAGNVIPPAGWLAGLKSIARENDALFIADEMITGFGRTGAMFGVNHEEVIPDIMTVGKGVGGGFPVAGVIASPELANSKPFANPSGSSSSYGGNPMAGAACDAALSIVIKDKLPENSAKVGKILLERLKALEQWPIIGDVRGRGLMIGVELVKDKRSKEPLSGALCGEIFEEALGRGLLTMAYTPSLRINPPLCITEAEALRGADILEESIATVVKRHGL
jgi:4-aminobutyrate aminotransferase / (S)-3-amino-2-methylpropionate transaminase / 5-aminovalerate transaminase